MVQTPARKASGDVQELPPSLALYRAIDEATILMPLYAWSDAYPYRSPLHDPWTGLPLEDAVSEQPITDRDPGDEDQPIAANVTQNASTMTSGGPATAIRYGQVASWDDYLAACQERDRLVADLATLRPLVRAAVNWGAVRRSITDLSIERYQEAQTDANAELEDALDSLPKQSWAWALEGE